MVVYYLNHTFTTTRCDDCGITFTMALLNEKDCVSKLVMVEDTKADACLLA